MNYQDIKLLPDMDPTSTTTLEYKDSIDSTSPWDITTIDNFFQIGTSFAFMQPDQLGAFSNSSLPFLDSDLSLLPESLPSTQSTSTLPPSWNNQITCQSTLSSKSESTMHAASEGIQQATKPQPRGRPRKDLSKKPTTSPPSDSIDKYRAKNRRASARCREKERNQAAALEEAFQEQTKRNLALKQATTDLREELFYLQMQALQHGNCGCEDVQRYNQHRAQSIAEAWEL
ncbi:unnamed protein product [Aureobasidium mustum]|uniref:BZIP domain-containing protein n=1 Tax=Aureobasidium mustum TaxID=2773714 RepID=A0A9N8PHK4_9PEZI|nr:unnamed protein product [Aureobasidium mustum]